jgi:glutathione peroxidase
MKQIISNHRLFLFVLFTAAFLPTIVCLSKETPGKVSNVTSLYDINALDINSNDVNLAIYKGNVLLIVNVASKCGFTPQYTGLENLYRKYKDKGFEILGFPSNDFLSQEPGTNEEIKSFCSLNYGVDFPMFSKISVKGKNIHPLYKFLTEKETDPNFAGKITWNFNKFLIDRKGNIINRFDSKTEPQNPEVTKAIEAVL